MPTLITGSELRAAVEKQTFIKNGRAGNAEDVKYDFRLSGEILKAKFGRPIDASQMSLVERTELVVEPGEVVFVLSVERLDLPVDMLAQLSPKRKMSQAGVLDRKSTRLNSSHRTISYAVFCLKKKKRT